MKFLLGCGALLMTAFCAVYAGDNAPWRPDFTPLCHRNEALRNSYLAAEQKAVAQSLAAMNKRGVNIIPTPKNIAFPGKDISVSRKDLPGKIVVYADKSAEVASGLVCQKLGQAIVVKDLSDKASVPEIAIVLLRKDLNADHPLLPANIPDFYQGYAIATRNENGRRTYVLAGKDYTGLLYAAVTFTKLIAFENDNILLPGVEVTDWPDVRYRLTGSLWYEFRKALSQGKTTEGAKRFIDWLLDHKINMTTEISTEKSKSIYLDAEKKKWNKEVADYARLRGVLVLARTISAVGDSTDTSIQKTCVDHNGYYYCWSDDALLKRRAEKMVQDLKETGDGAVFIHSVDTLNSKWQDRCPKCRERFGDDRFSGDANVFNCYRDEIRKSFPDMPIIIVPRPYGGGVDSAVWIEKGEMKAKDDLLRFSKMLAPDVYICDRESRRSDFLSWVNSFRQPMSPCVMAWYLSPFLDGRDFTPMARFFRTYSYPLADEVADYGTASASRDRVQSLAFEEFTWNLNSPGSAEYDHTPEVYADIWDPFGEDMSKNQELQKLVKRICDDVFGSKVSKYFYNSQLLFTDSNFANNWQDMCYALRNGYMTSGKGLMPDIDDQKCAAYMDRIYRNSDKIVNDMEAVKKVAPDPEIAGMANWYLFKHYSVRAVAHVQSLLLRADLASKKGGHAQAARLMEETDRVYGEAMQKFKTDCQAIQGEKHEIWGKVPRLPDTAGKELKNRMDMINVKVQSRKTMAERKLKKAAAKQDEARANKPIQAAVFHPDSKGGLTFGGQGLINLLRGINDIMTDEIDNLAPETIKKYDCIIFPDCKSLGSVAVNVNDIRAYVVDHGGGIYFEHDSCGFNRFPLKDSVFPEIAHVADRIGEPPISTKYKAGDRILKIVKQHPVTEGNLTGTTFEQVYFDHLQLVNETGEIIAEDFYGKPVVIAGQAGDGRVVFNGGITLNVAENKELDKPLPTVEGEIIVNSVRWLAKSKKGTEIIMSDLKKTDKTLTDREASVISFKPQIIPCKPLHNVVLYAQCFNAKDLRAISPKTEIAKIDALTEKWEAEENVIINADSYPQIKVKLEFSSKEGNGSIARIVGSRE